MFVVNILKVEFNRFIDTAQTLQLPTTSATATHLSFVPGEHSGDSVVDIDAVGRVLGQFWMVEIISRFITLGCRRVGLIGHFANIMDERVARLSCFEGRIDLINELFKHGSYFLIMFNLLTMMYFTF